MRIGEHAIRWLRDDPARGIGGPAGYYRLTAD
jgi:hypothetical protein